MSNAATILNELVAMSRHLGEPERDLAILGEGNTSALCDDGTFWVKASGTELRTIGAQGFVQMRLAATCAIAAREGLDDSGVKAALEAAKADPNIASRPSVETVLHALALSQAGATFVGHTHPTAVNALACSAVVEQAISGRLFPDEIVACGPAVAYVPYTDPGLPLARAVGAAFCAFAAEWGVAPKVVLMQNHGLIALGRSPSEVENITAMYVKTCRVLMGTYAFGGPHLLTAANVQRISTRPDEAYRKQQLKLG